MIKDSMHRHVNFLEEEDFIHACEFRTTQADEVILVQDAQSTDLFIVSKGKFVLSDARGTEFVVAVLNKGDIFGHMPFIPPPRASICRKVVSVSSGELLVLSQESFFSFIEQKPELALRVLCTLANIITDRLQTADSTLSLLLDNSESRERFEMRRLLKELRGSMSILSSD
ncbi:MAG: cyclic nucleotide-binding domain-containing protein [Candidatus Fermentibacteria bacterium]